MIRNLVMLFLLFALLAVAQAPAPSEWKPVEDALGRSGSMQPGGVYKFSLPRTDMHVRLGDVDVAAPLALGSWLAFKKTGSDPDATVMGDLVLSEAELTPVLSSLQQHGIEQTAVHNHLIGETPRVIYMHISGHGDAVKLAQALHTALALTKTPGASPTTAAPPKLDFDTVAITKTLGHDGKQAGNVWQVSVPRPEKITENAMEVPPAMGTATALNFQSTGGGRAAITGDFVLLANEVNPVIRALRDNGIQVTALHTHMLNEQPHVLFMHFWAHDDAQKLAHGLRAALDQIGKH
jgi:hypothetical protein